MPGQYYFKNDLFLESVQLFFLINHKNSTALPVHSIPNKYFLSSTRTHTLTRQKAFVCGRQTYYKQPRLHSRCFQSTNYGQQTARKVSIEAPCWIPYTRCIVSFALHWIGPSGPRGPRRRPHCGGRDTFSLTKLEWRKLAGEGKSGIRSKVRSRSYAEGSLLR